MRYVQRDGWFSICLVSTLHEAAPPVDSYIRGEQSPGCMRFRSTGDGRSRFEWLQKIDMKVSSRFSGHRLCRTYGMVLTPWCSRRPMWVC